MTVTSWVVAVIIVGAGFWLFIKSKYETIQQGQLKASIYGIAFGAIAFGVLKIPGDLGDFLTATGVLFFVVALLMIVFAFAVLPFYGKDEEKENADNGPSKDASLDQPEDPTNPAESQYRHYLAIETSGRIRANIVYEEVDGTILGCYSGYSGGGTQDYRLFLIDHDNDVVLVTDDEGEFDEAYWRMVPALQKERAKYELWEDEDVDDGSTLSSFGKEILSNKEFDGETGLKVFSSENFDDDVVLNIQDEWTLTFGLQNDDENRLAGRSSSGTTEQKEENSSIDWSNMEDVLKELENDAFALENADQKLRADKEFMMAAVQIEGLTLQYADDSLKADKEVVMAAVQNDGSAFGDADDSLKADKEVVMAAVNQDGTVLYAVDDSLRADKEVVLAAVQQSGWALEHAGDVFRADREIVLAAVQQDGYVLEHADDALKADREIVLAAVEPEGYGGALEYADASLQNDPQLIKAAED